MSSKQPLRYLLDLAGRTYELKTIKGEEALSRPSRFELSFHVDDTDPLDTEAIISGPATLHLDRDGAVRSIALWVTNAERMATRKIKGRAGGALVELVLESRLAMLRERTDIRVFRNKTAPTIVAEVLMAMGVNVEQRLRDTYVVRPYCVEFRESDFDFAARLLEDEGIFYFVADDGTVVLGDHPSSYDDKVAVLPFRHGAGLDQNVDSVHSVGQRGSMTAGKITLRDFNPDTPTLDMDVSATGPTEGGAEWYDYPGEYLEPGEGQIKAKKRADALLCEHQRLVGTSFCAALRPGARFQLTETPMGVREGGLVITRVAHAFKRDESGFSVQFESLRESVTFRPMMGTRVPVEPNPLTGYTTGPAGADIHTNEWGQVKVWFPWDRLQAKDDNVSHWVPILQDNTGQSSAIMRTRWEVVCQFMEGDPDRPVVMGRVFNPEDPPYAPLPFNKTRTSLRSLTSPRTEEGENFIDFDDRQGFEAVMISACRDQNIVVGNEKNEQIDNSETNVVGGNETIKITGEQLITVKKGLFPITNGNQTKEVTGEHLQNVTGTWGATVKENSTLKITGEHKRTCGSSDTTQVGENLEETITGDVKESCLKSNVTTAFVEGTLTVTGTHTETAKKSKVTTVKAKREEVVTGSLYETADKEIACRNEDTRDLIVTKDITVDAKKNLLLAGAEKLIGKCDTSSMTAQQAVTLKVGETMIKMQDGRVEILAVKRVVFEMSADNTWNAYTGVQDPPEDMAVPLSDEEKILAAAP